MATTTNFGWTTPDDTSLVKDGAAAIRTLGQSIDTSMMDLEGGTTGQVLSKASNTDMDFTWVTTDDANAIQNSIVDAKGDLIAATANDTPARLAIGTNGTVLTADSAEATGMKWAAVPSQALTLISSTTFSGSSGHNVNDVFSATYQNYLVQLNMDSPSATGYQQLRLRVSGADNTTSNYFWSGIYNISNATTPAGEGASSQTSFTYGYIESAGTAGCTFNIANPFETKATTYSNIMARTTGSQSLIYSNAGAFNTTTSFTGFTLYPASGTITGKVRVYGYNN
jgi:hypothetical protein